MSNHLNVFVTETFKQGDVEKSNYTKVGVLFPHKKGGGYNLKIVDGVSVSGELVIFPPSEESQNQD